MVISKPFSSLLHFVSFLILAFSTNAASAIKSHKEADFDRIFPLFKNPELTATQAKSFVSELETQAGFSEDWWDKEAMVWVDAVSNWPNPAQDPEIQALVLYGRHSENHITVQNDCSGTQVIGGNQIAFLIQDIVCTALPSNPSDPLFLIQEGGALYLNGFTIRTDDGNGGYLKSGYGILMEGDDAILFGGGYKPGIGKIEGFDIGVSAISGVAKAAIPDSLVITQVAANHNRTAGFLIYSSHGEFKYLQANHNDGYGVMADISQSSKWEYVRANHNGYFGITTASEKSEWKYVQANHNAQYGLAVSASVESDWKYIQANHNDVYGVFAYSDRSDWGYIQANRNGSGGVIAINSDEDQWQIIQTNHNGQAENESVALESDLHKFQFLNHAQQNLQSDSTDIFVGFGALALSNRSEWKYIQANHNGPQVDLSLGLNESLELTSLGFALEGNENKASHIQANHNGGQGTINTTNEINAIFSLTGGSYILGNGNAFKAVHAHHNSDRVTINGTEPTSSDSNNLNFVNVGLFYDGSSNSFDKVLTWHNGNEIKATHMRLAAFVDSGVVGGYGFPVPPSEINANNEESLENELYQGVAIGNGSRGRFSRIPADSVIDQFNSVGLFLVDGQTTISNSLAMFNGEQGRHKIDGCVELNPTHLAFNCTSGGIQMVNGLVRGVFSAFNGLANQLNHTLIAGIVNHIVPNTIEAAAVTRIPEVKNTWSVRNHSNQAGGVKGYGLVSVMEQSEAEITDVSPIMIADNTFAHNEIGLDYLGFNSSLSNNGGIYNNQVLNNRSDGIIIRGNNNEVTNNSVEENGHNGIVVGDYGANMTSHGNQIERNTSISNKTYNIVDTAEPENCTEHYNVWEQNLIENKEQPPCLQS